LNITDLTILVIGVATFMVVLVGLVVRLSELSRK
jgi:hypothetical protein